MKYLWLVLSTLLLAGSASAQVVLPITIILDENGNGSAHGISLVSFTAQDPGPGGLPNALTYLLNMGFPSYPLSVTPGDVFLFDNGNPADIEDIVRFNPCVTPCVVPTAIFYSDILDGADALADIGLPTEFYPGWSIPEIGAEGFNWAYYVPGIGQPGYGGYPYQLTYVLISDNVPEPGTLCLLGAGLVLIGVTRRRRF